LRGHVLDVHIGIHDFEQGAPQRMRFDVDLYVPYAQSDPSRDNIEDIVDYDFIRAIVRQRTAAGNSSNDEQRIRQRAKNYQCQHVLAQDALAQNKSVLRADGHNQSQAGGKAGQGVMHALNVI
jgi:hypothetical protein